MWHAFDNQPHFAVENVNDLLLRMRVRGHPTSRRECCEHLIHRFAVCDRLAGDPGTNFNRRILSLHSQNPTTGVRMTRMFWSDRLAETNSIRLQIRFYLLVSWVSDLFVSYAFPPATDCWQDARHENLYVINHNCIRGFDRDPFVCANSRHVTGYWHCPGWRRDCPN